MLFLSKQQAQILVLVASVYLICGSSQACRVSSPKLDNYIRATLDRLLDGKQLEHIYWPKEPLDASALSRATGINLTLVETQFELNDTIIGSKVNVDRVASKNDILVRDMFITCSADLGGIYTFSMNLLLKNPFKNIEFTFLPPSSDLQLQFEGRDEEERQVAAGNRFETNRGTHLDDKIEKVFHITLPQSTSFLVRLNQRVSYDECLMIKYVQLASNISYELDCPKCTPAERSYLDRIFSKRMAKLDNELDKMLSEKLSLGLGVVLSQQRLYLDLYVNQK